MPKESKHYTPSGIIDGICNVKDEEIGELDKLIHNLTRQLAVAKAVREALSSGAPHVQATPSQPKQPAGRQPVKKSGRKSSIQVTDKTRHVGRCILQHGAMTKDELASVLGWPRQAVAMTIGRSKKHFLCRDGGKYLVGDELASLLENE